MKRREISKTNMIFGVCAGIGVLMGMIAARGGFESLEVGVLDIGMRQRSKPPDPRLAIIEIERESEKQVGESWPWKHRRRYLAQMVYNLTDAGVKSGGLLVWVEREGEEREDEELASALGQSPFFVVQPYASYPSSASGISQIDAWIDLPKPLQDAAKGAFAFSNLDTEEQLYKVQLLAQRKKENHYALDLWLICHYFGIGPEALQLKESFWHGKYLQMPHPSAPDDRTLKIPLDERGRLLVNLSDNAFASESFIVVHNRSNPSKFESDKALEGGLKANALKYGGKIVLVGVTTYPPPVTTRFGNQTELSLHAHAINTILTESFLYRLSGRMKFVYTLLMGLVFALAMTTLVKWGWRWKFLGALLCCFGLHALIVAIGVTAGMWVDFVGPGAALLLCSVTTTVGLSHLERHTAELERYKAEVERRKVEEEFKAREVALEGITGLALEIVDHSHQAKRKVNIPFKFRLRLHALIIEHLHERFVSPPQTAEKPPLLSTVVRNALKQAVKDRFKGVEHLEIPEEKEVSIELENLTCHLSHPHPIHVRQPSMLQAALNCVIANALKILEKKSGSRELSIHSDGNDRDYTVIIRDNGQPFKQETIEHLEKKSRAELLKWMKEELEKLDRLDEEEASPLFNHLPVGLGLLLSKFIVEEFYSGDFSIHNDPESKGVIIKCKAN